MATLQPQPTLTLYSDNDYKGQLTTIKANTPTITTNIKSLKTQASTYVLVYDQPNYAGNARLVPPNTNITNTAFPIKSVKVSAQPSPNFMNGSALLQPPAINVQSSPKPTSTDVPRYKKKYEKYMHDPKDYVSIVGPVMVLSDIFFLPFRLFVNLLIYNGSDNADTTGAYFIAFFLYIIIIFIAILAGLGYGGYKLWQDVFSDDPTENLKHSQST
jgi:hypothetical protein